MSEDTARKIKDILNDQGYCVDSLSGGRHFTKEDSDGSLRHVFVTNTNVGQWKTEKGNWTELHGSVERVPHSDFLQKLQLG